MLIISHRGCWSNAAEQNTRLAFTRSFDLGFGVETDLREANGKLVIAHDFVKGNEMSFEELLKLLAGRNLPLALNIKADGMHDLIKDLLLKYNHDNYFTFDMSIPDLVVQLCANLKVFSGLSDILNPAPLLASCSGVWLDCFKTIWYNTQLIEEIIDNGKKLCVVSAELHKRPLEHQWDLIKRCKYLNSDNLLLCTDWPEKAKVFFYE
ncbi:phosphodiesterase [Bartonella sp. TP]|uniref:phosphodiesterase n=1 Tax=Bartonella sp. TP TaxID=3057550 RepID=UPI0025B1196F|nr:phosphodiesterase [Bartonella sp. TP]MDN5249321.1 phosphodiesterase [Alphaproteobacteria bacterium]WJW79691.1 phosphodiesterase [Bartonella sp. TP]